MTLRERAKLGNQAFARKSRDRAAVLFQLLDNGENIKRAAFKAGMSDRTARRWRQRGLG